MPITREERNARRRERYRADPEKHKAYQREWLRNNPENRRAASRRWRVNNPDKVKAYRESPETRAYSRNLRLKSEYGITQSDYDAMVEKQNGICPICELEKKLVVDHDHETGKVRALLCGQCNTGLGSLKDSPQIVEKALQYLIEWERKRD